MGVLALFERLCLIQWFRSCMFPITGSALNYPTTPDKQTLAVSAQSSIAPSLHLSLHASGRNTSASLAVPPANPTFVNPTKILVCEFCDASFTSNSGLIRHKNSVHLKKMRHKCHVCGKGFSVREPFEDHINMHNNIKAHKCPLCPSVFTYKTSLYHHFRKHGNPADSEEMTWSMRLWRKWWLT